MWPFRRRPNSEARSVENPRIPLSSASAWSSLFGEWSSKAGITVTRDVALEVPAVSGAVGFLSGTFASLPAPVYLRTKDGREKADGHAVAILLHDWVNDEYLTSYQWRKQAFANVLLDGRSLTFIEGKKTGRITNLWPLDVRNTEIVRKGGRKKYILKEGTSSAKEYDADEIIDIPFMLRGDGISHVVPVYQLRGAIGLSIAMENYASKFFLNGGVPPLAMQMPRGASVTAGSRASADVADMVKSAGDDRRLVLPMPEGHRLEPIGFNPEQGQLIEARMMQLRQIACFYGLPPVFLQDLQFGTFSNTEQQANILVKHTLVQWLECWESELNAKLFGPRSKFYIEFNVDGLLRGSFGERMAGYAQAIQNAVLKPNEARDQENRPRDDNGDVLLIQGATVPLGTQPTAAAPTPPKEPTP